MRPVDFAGAVDGHGPNAGIRLDLADAKGFPGTGSDFATPDFALGPTARPALGSHLA